MNALTKYREEHPEYADVGDVKLATALHRKYYASMPVGDFYKAVGLTETIDPTEGMSGLGKFAAGYGKATVDAGRGIAQALTPDDSEFGRNLQASIDESQQRDKPLMNTGAGAAGNLVNSIAMAAPTAAIPGANTVLGAAAIGGVTGALQPTASNESTIDKAGTGALFGAGGQALGRALPSVARALVAPFHQGGRERLAGEVIQRFASNADEVTRRAGQASNVPGVQYSLAEATQDPGLAILQRGAQSLDPSVSGPLTRQGVENIDAARGALQNIGGDDAAMQAALASRQAASGPLYDAARQTQSTVTPELAALFQRPAVREAYQTAIENAANRGVTLPALDTIQPGATVGGDVLHTIKMALDANISGAPMRGIAGDTANAMGDARTAMLGEIDSAIPDYAQARQAYTAGSRPINQMEVGRALYDRLAPALSDSAGATLPRTRAESYAAALRNGDQVAQTATGMPNARLDSVMDPQQLEQIYGVRDFLARRAAVDELGRGAGSNTAQNIASQNILRQVIGPLGLPESWGESVLSRTLGRGADVLMRPAETAIQETLVEALRNPQRGAQLLQRLNPSQRQRLVEALYQRALPAVSVGSGAYAAGQ